MNHTFLYDLFRQAKRKCCNVIMFYTIRFLWMLCQKIVTRLATWSMQYIKIFGDGGRCFKRLTKYYGLSVKYKEVSNITI
jgi:hypothetical protein